MLSFNMVVSFLAMVFEPGSSGTAEGAEGPQALSRWFPMAGRASAGSAAPPFHVRSPGLIVREPEPNGGQRGQDITRVANAQLQHDRLLF